MTGHKSEQINDLLRAELARLIEEEISLDSGLITVSYVDCSPDLRQAKVAVSVLPEKLFGSALAELKRKSGDFTRQLRSRTRLRRIPHFSWVADDTEAKAAVIENLLNSLK